MLVKLQRTDIMPSNGVAIMRRPAKPVDLAIVGGGISGLVTLLGILKHTDASQVRAHVYEAHSTFTETGAGISFLPNTIRAMKMLDSRIHDGYWKIAIPPTAGPPKGGKEFRFAFGCDSKDGTSFKTLDIFQRADVRKNGGPGLLRAAFLDLLTDLVPSESDDARGQGPYISFSKKLVEITECNGGDGGVDLRFADGSTTHADAVIGGDRIRSGVRKIMLTATGEVEAIPPVFSGGYAYRGLIPLNKDGVTLPPDFVDNLIFQLGYTGHVFTYPIKDGELLNVIATHHSENPQWQHEKWVIPATREDMARDFQSFGKPTQTVVENMEKLDIWALFQARPCKRYYKGGKICLLGDSAHVSFQSQELRL